MTRLRMSLVTGGTITGLALAGLLAAPAFASTAGHKGGNPSPCPTVTVTVSPVVSNGANGHVKCPTPTPTPTVPTPTPTPTPTLVQQDFDLNIGGLLNPTGANYPVLATGDFAANLGKGNSLTPTVDKWTTTAGSVDVHHEALSGARVDLITCSISVTQNDMPWYFSNGTGAFSRIRGVGFYTLRGLLSFPTHDFRCPELTGLSNWQADKDLNSSTGGGLPAPMDESFAVQGTGVSFFTSSTKPCTNPYSIMGGALLRPAAA